MVGVFAFCILQWCNVTWLWPSRVSSRAQSTAAALGTCNRFSCLSCTRGSSDYLDSDRHWVNHQSAHTLLSLTSLECPDLSSTMWVSESSLPNSGSHFRVMEAGILSEVSTRRNSVPQGPAPLCPVVSSASRDLPFPYRGSLSIPCLMSRARSVQGSSASLILTLPHPHPLQRPP